MKRSSTGFTNDRVPESVWTPEPDMWTYSDAIMALRKARTQDTITSEDLQKLVDDFLNKGGKIQQIPVGVSAEDPLNVDYRIIHAMGYDDGKSIEDKRLHRERIIERVSRRIYGNDQNLVNQIRECSSKGMTRKETLIAIGVSDEKLQRLLRDYFKGDPIADAFGRRTRA